MANGKGDFTLQMRKIVDEYGKEASAAIENASVGVAAAAANKLKANSPKSKHHTRKYAEGWRYKREPNGTVVYNATNYQLTHLLENGHAVVNGTGRVGNAPAVKHIEPVEQWAVEEFENRIRRDLER